MLRDGLIPRTMKAVVLLSGDGISRTAGVVSCRGLNWDAFNSVNGCCKGGCLRKRFLTDRVISTVCVLSGCSEA